MKKMILGLALCLGLSQVVVAEKTTVKGLPEDAKGAMAWIKAHPKTTAAIVAALTYGTFAAVEIYKADGKDGKFAKAKAGAWEAAKDLTVYPAGWVAGKAVASKDAVWENMKAHTRLWVGIPAGVVAVIAAAVIADIATTDKEAQTRLTNIWNKLFKKAAKTEEVTEEVVEEAAV
jgi:hypothetical protein